MHLNPQRHDFHMPDGPEQRARDELFLSRLGKEEQNIEPFPSRWQVFRTQMPYDLHANTIFRTCPVVQPWLYGYDAIKEVENVVKESPGFSLGKEKL
jgi:salicylate hydroxylase